MSSSTKIFRSYYRVIFLASIFVFIGAVLLLLLEFKNRLDYESQVLRQDFQSSIYSLSSVIDGALCRAEALQKKATFDLAHPEVAQTSVLLNYFNQATDNYFHLDSLPVSLQKECANLTGLGQFEQLNDSQKEQIRVALNLNPLLKNLVESLSYVPYAYYIRKDFFMIYPFMLSTDFRLTEDIVSRIDKVYGVVYPQNNPTKKHAWTKAYPDESGKGLMVSAMYPIYKNNRYEALIGFDFTLDQLNKIIGNSQRSLGEVFIVDEYDQLIAHPKLVSSADTTIQSFRVAMPFLKTIKELEKWQERNLIEIDNFFVFYQQVPNTSWQLVYKVSKNKLYWHIFKEVGLNFVFVISVIFSVILITIYYAQKRMILPAEKLIIHLQKEQAQQGERNWDVPKEWKVWFELVSDTFSENRSILEELQNVNENLERTVQERTHEVMFQNENLKQQQEEILVQKGAIEAKNRALEQQNNHITSGIRYAKTIQEAILPPYSSIESFFTNFFIIYKPQQVVSGDFYWFHYNDNYVFWALVDCTGHGVPGAFMSLLGYSALNQIVQGRKIFDNSLILNALDRNIRRILRKESNENSDGMEISLCRMDKHSKEIVFAGSKQTIFVAYNQELLRIRGDRYSIGGRVYSDQRFSNQNIRYEPNMVIYMFTDGLTDQQNYRRQRIGTQRFFDKMQDICHLSISQQEQIVLHFIQQFKGNESQRDDLSMWTVQIP